MSSAFAEDINVVFKKGEAFVTNSDGEMTILVRGMKLQEIDTIKTGENSFVILNIKGHSNYRVEENTVLTIDDLPYFYENSDKLEQGGSLILKTGTILIDVIKKFDEPALEIKAKNSVMGVRGTKFLVSSDSETDDILLSVDSGMVEIKNLLTNNTDFVQKDESIYMEKGNVFTQRRKYNFSKDIDWNINQRKLKTTFKSLRKKIRDEINAKKSSWKVDKSRIEKIKKKLKKRYENSFKINQNLEESKLLKSRIRSVYKKREKLRLDNLKQGDIRLERLEKLNRNKLDKLKRERLKERRNQKKIIRQKLPPPPTTSTN